MKRIVLLLALAAPLAARAQTPAPAKPAAKATTPTTAATRPAVKRPAGVTTIKLPVAPPNIPHVKGIPKPAFALFYQDITIGSGKLAEPDKLYHVQYTGWRAADGVKFDSSFDHKQPLLDKDGKPQKDADGKLKLGEPQPFVFPQGRGRLIPGWDQGFEGMKVGGKRRLYIPYQLAYGSRDIPARGEDHPGIPPKSDLIFDIELVDVTDMPQAPAGGRPMPRPGAPGMSPLPSKPAAPSTPPASGTAPAPATPTAPAPAPGSPATPTAPPAPSTQPATSPSTPPASSASPSTAPPAASKPPQSN